MPATTFARFLPPLEARVGTFGSVSGCLTSRPWLMRYDGSLTGDRDRSHHRRAPRWTPSTRRPDLATQRPGTRGTRAHSRGIVEPCHCRAAQRDRTYGRGACHADIPEARLARVIRPASPGPRCPCIPPRMIVTASSDPLAPRLMARTRSLPGCRKWQIVTGDRAWFFRKALGAVNRERPIVT
jgi:hypothetical protein